MKSIKTVQNGQMVQSESIHFRKISSNKNYITGRKKAPKNCFKTDLKHLILELGNTNDCKEELSSLLCVETQKYGQKQCFQL